MDVPLVTCPVTGSSVSMIEKNRTFLAGFDAELAQELAAVLPDDTIELVEARKAGKTLKAHGTWVHSRYHPEREASTLVSRQKGPPARCHIHFGFGLGYLARADPPPDGGILIVYEPDPVLLATILTQHRLEQLLPPGRMMLICRFERFREALRAFEGDDLSVRVLVNPWHGQQHKRALSECIEAIQFERNRRALRQKTLDCGRRIFLEGTLRSVKQASATPGVGRLEGRLRNIPALIVAAGPSLEASLPTLAAFRQHVAVFAVSRAVRPLERCGIAPDFLVHTETRDYFHLIADASNLEDTVFLLSEQAHPHFYADGQRVLVYHNPVNEISRMLQRKQPRQDLRFLATAGSVATEAFSLAVLMGCNPIILTGQDLALKTGQHYADEDGNRPLLKDGDLRKVQGYWGGRVSSVANYMHFIEWYEDAAGSWQKTRPDLKLVNATGGGARIRGFEPQSLRHALASCRASDARSAIRQLHQYLDTPGALSGQPRRYRGLLREWLQEVRALRGLAESALVGIGSEPASGACSALEQRLARSLKDMPWLTAFIFQQVFDQRKGKLMLNESAQIAEVLEDAIIEAKNLETILGASL